MKVRLLGPQSWIIGGTEQTDVCTAQSGTCTAREVLDQLVAAHPGLQAKLFGEGQELQRGVNLFVGDRSIKCLDGLGTLLEDGDELVLLPLLCGG